MTICGFSLDLTANAVDHHTSLTMTQGRNVRGDEIMGFGKSANSAMWRPQTGWLKVRATLFSLLVMPLTIGVVGGLASCTTLIHEGSMDSWDTVQFFFGQGAIVGVPTGVLLFPLVFFVAKRFPILICWMFLTVSTTIVSVLTAFTIPPDVHVVWVSGGVGFMVGYVALMSLVAPRCQSEQSDGKE
jgi:hypothetical protein